ncbi:Uncharacterised protein [Mycobacteroides abscessus subsp. abscessus]|nr:Uncharacterised protein [Mycobacteroides abscessus subsp. abscessus]
MDAKTSVSTSTWAPDTADTGTMSTSGPTSCDTDSSCSATRSLLTLSILVTIAISVVRGATSLICS